MSKNKKRWTIVTACVAVVAIAAVSLGFASPREADVEEEAENVVLVDTDTPFLGNIVVTGEFVATVEPNQQVYVYPKVAGEVLEANFSIGDTVEAGDVLLQLDSTDLQFNIRQTQAAVSNAQELANYNVAMSKKDLETYQFNVEGGYNTTLITAEKAVGTAEAQVQYWAAQVSTARRALGIYRDDYDEDYYDHHYSDDSTYVSLRGNLTAAQAQLETAQVQLEQAEETYRATQMLVKEQEVTANDAVNIAEINANLSSQYIQLESLRNSLSYYTVTAPISGVIEQRNVDPHDMASQQTPVYVISNKEAMTVSFNVSEATLGFMQLGDTITLEKNGSTCPGTISEISTMVDAQTGLFKIKAIVENAPFSMLSGSTLKIYADTHKAENDIMIPIDSVYYNNGQPYVYVLDGSIARKTWIETGIADTVNIQVLSGLSLNDQIVATWSPGLDDGVEVTLPGQLDAGTDSTADSNDSEAEAGDSADAEANDDSEENDDTPSAENDETETDTPSSDTEGDAE